MLVKDSIKRKKPGGGELRSKKVAEISNSAAVRDYQGAARWVSDAEPILSVSAFSEKITEKQVFVLTVTLHT